MGLETNLRFSNGVAIVDLPERLAPGREGDTMRERLLALLDQGHTRILLNLAPITQADSGGLGDLVAAYAAVTRRGGEIRLVHPRPKLLAMLRMTHIDSLFEICDDESTAVRDFKRAAPAASE
jgi:anti-sigma B factor antagonist